VKTVGLMRTTILYLAGALWEYTVALASHLSSLPQVCTNFQVHTGMDVFLHPLILTVKASRKGRGGQGGTFRGHVETNYLKRVVQVFSWRKR